MASILSCKSCSKCFSDPRLLPCLHVFCKTCLEPLYSQDEGTIACPTCNSISTCPPAQLPRHLRIERDSLLSRVQRSPEETVCSSCFENNKAEAYCKDCSTPVCSDCIKNHTKFKIMTNHSIVSLTQSQPVAVNRVSCILHPEEAIKYYCSTCSCLVCSECLFTHKEHDWCPINTTDIVQNDSPPAKRGWPVRLVQKEKDELQSVLPELEEAIPLMVKPAENIDDFVKNIRVNKDRAKGEINENFKQIAYQITDAIENRRVELIQEVENTAIAKITRLQIQKEGLDKISSGLQLALQAGSIACKEYGNVELLAVKGTILKASNDLLLESRSTDLQPISSSSLCVSIDNTQLIESISSLGSIVSVYPLYCSLIDINPELAIGVARGCECVVTLQTRDENGEDLTEGIANVMATVTDPSTGSEVSKCVVGNLDNGQYKISFNNPTEGQYQLSITIDNTNISPYTISVRDYTAIENPVTTVNETSDIVYYVAINPHDNQYYVTSTCGSIKVYNSNMAAVRTITVDGHWLKGIAIDGVIFVASASTHKIIKATLDGEVLTSVGTKGTGELEFNWPLGLCLTRDGLLLVADSKNKRVQVLGSDLSFIRFISCLSIVFGVSVDGNDNIHVAVSNRGVEVFSSIGEKITEYGQGVLTKARDLAFLPSNSRYSVITNFSTRNKVCVFDWSNNTLIHTIRDCGNRPIGVTIDQEGSIIVCDENKISKF